MLNKALVILWAMAACLSPAAFADVSAQEEDSRVTAAKQLGIVLPDLVSQSDIIGLALAVVVDDQVVLKSASGVTRLGGGLAVTPQTVFRIASLSKGFTTTLSALLVDSGRLRWDESVSQIVPEFTLADSSAEKVTVEMLLGQRTGLPHFAYDNLLEARVDVNRILQRLSEVELMCPVGTCYSYQNVAFSAIGPIIEARTGQSLAGALEQEVFAPLGMRQASIGLEGLHASEAWAEPHVRTRRGWTPVAVKDTYYRVAPASGINASLDDMIIWLKAQMGQATDLLDTELLAEIHRPRVNSTRELYSQRWRRQRIATAHYGLGWRVFDYRGHRLIFHAGGVAGYRAQIAFMPDLGLGMVAMWNSTSGRAWGLLPTLYDKALEIRSSDWMGLNAGRGQAAAAR